MFLTPPPKVFPDATRIGSGSALALSWSPGTSGSELELSFISLYGGMVLRRPGDDGEFVLPWEDLSVLPRGTNELELFLIRRRSTEVSTALGVVRVEIEQVESGTFFIEPRRVPRIGRRW